jgi:hypothetical protein
VLIGGVFDGVFRIFNGFIYLFSSVFSWSIVASEKQKAETQ